MGYPQDSEPPAKRLKTSEPYRRHPSNHIPSSDAPVPAAPDVMPSDTVVDSWPPDASATFSTGEPSWPWQPASFELPPDQLFYSLPPAEHHDGWRASLLPGTTASPVTGSDLSPITASPSHRPQLLHQPQTSTVVPATAATAGPNVTQAASNDRRSSASKDVTKRDKRDKLVSPFRDCLGTFGTFNTIAFTQPNEGFVNGYVKVRWASKPGQHSAGDSQNTPRTANVDASLWTPALTTGPTTTPTSVPGAVAGPTPTVLTSQAALHSPVMNEFSGVVDYDSPLLTSDATSLSPTRTDMASSFGTAPSSAPSPQASPPDTMVIQSTKPRMVPPQFGFQAKVESRTDRRFWEFYVKNWCPGRSILRSTNLWLNDFAQMQQNDGVRSAIQSLAGVYIYDYVRQDNISKRVNELFKIAEARLTHLLNDPGSLQADQASELITIAVILSMQDVVLTERRLKKPNYPRWLQGFLQSEYALELTDPGSRFWRQNNVQLTSLRVSQSIIVGRAVILAQPMMPLTPPEEFDMKRDSKRFGWLLYGTEQEMYEIHGGCGFSKKLLHLLSQVTYCATRLQQDGESVVTQMTVRFLHTELQEMRQWSSESKSWEEAKAGPQTIDWVRNYGYIIHSSNAMTDVTAEAWRLAALIYLQCRGLRLPRNHPEVIANLTDLASCIRIMPTSGTHFTAQAPLFPVFLLGMLATDPRHKEVSRQWFEQVVQTPVRSSVPPLFEALKRTWSWIEEEVAVDHQEPPESIGKRHPWWESLVARVAVEEPETLCLT